MSLKSAFGHNGYEDITDFSSGVRLENLLTQEDKALSDRLYKINVWIKNRSMSALYYATVVVGSKRYYISNTRHDKYLGQKVLDSDLKETSFFFQGDIQKYVGARRKKLVLKGAFQRVESSFEKWFHSKYKVCGFTTIILPVDHHRYGYT